MDNTIDFGWLNPEFEFDQTLTGGQDNDLLQGGEQNDRIQGLDGNDTLEDFGGTNYLEGGDGDDILNGGSGNDALIGDSTGSLGFATVDNQVFLVFNFGVGGGNDSLNGGDGDDVLDGGYGNDTIIGGEGDDRLWSGHNYPDFNVGAESYDYLDGGAGNDTLVSAFGSDTLIGGPGKDNLLGKSGSDRLVGGDGDDSLAGGLDNDTLIGGSGADDFRLSLPIGGIDTVEDYNAAEGDQLIISAPDSIVVDQFQYNSETGELSYNRRQFAQLPTGLDFVPEQDLVLDLYPSFFGIDPDFIGILAYEF